MVILGAIVGFTWVLMTILADFPDLDGIPVLGTILQVLLVLCLVVLVVLGIPYLLILGVIRLKFMVRNRKARGVIGDWAAFHRWHFEPGSPNWKGPSPDGILRARNLTVAMAQASRELGLTFKVDNPQKIRLSDVAHGEFHGMKGVFCTVRGLDNPLHHGRLIGLETNLHLPPLAYIDVSLRTLWQTREQDFESLRFNTGWHVVAQDPRFASDVTHQGVIVLLNQSPSTTTRIDLAPGWIVAWLPEKLEGQHLESNLVLLRQLADHVPNFVREDYRR